MRWRHGKTNVPEYTRPATWDDVKPRARMLSDADVVAFDPRTIIDHATFKSPAEPSSGMRLAGPATTAIPSSVS